MGCKLRHYPSVAVNIENLNGQIDFNSVFGRSGPVHIDIGCGRGNFVLNEARAREQVNFLGVEKASRFYRISVDRMGRWGVGNVRILRADSVRFLREFVPGESVDCFHIYFPDPWPKRRHHKRRFFCQENLDLLVRCLKKGGRIQVVTDYAEYFEVISDLFKQNGEWLAACEFIPAAGARDAELVGTNYERKYNGCGRDIFKAAVRKF